MGSSRDTAYHAVFKNQNDSEKKQDGIILKIDLEKAYDKVKWPFVQQIRGMKEF